MPLMPISILLCTHRTNRFFGSRVGQLPPTLRKPSEGHLQGLGQNLGVNCSSGIILPERPQLWNRGDSAGRVRHPLDNTRVHLIVGPAISDLASLSVS